MGTNLELRTQADKYFEQSCKELGITNALPDVSMLPERDQKAILAYYKLSVIIQCVNDGWEPDWDSSELKYFPAHYGATAGLGYSNTYFAASSTFATIGSRLYFKNRELAAEWGQKLLPLYEDFLLIQK